MQNIYAFSVFKKGSNGQLTLCSEDRADARYIFFHIKITDS